MLKVVTGLPQIIFFVWSLHAPFFFLPPLHHHALLDVSVRVCIDVLMILCTFLPVLLHLLLPGDLLLLWSLLLLLLLLLLWSLWPT